MDLSALLPSLVMFTGLALHCTLSAVDDEDASASDVDPNVIVVEPDAAAGR